MPINNPSYPPIKYTSRDFRSIKNDLVEYAKQYYPDTYRDFNDASFGSLMVDMVSYVGDILSFYLDYQANESFLQTSTEYANILKHGKALGYKFNYNPTAYGVVTLFVSVPATANGLGVDVNYVPILKKGSTFSSTNGNIYTLNEDVDFADPLNETVVGTVNKTTVLPTNYIIRANGQV